jgi:hypothetical protein
MDFDFIQQYTYYNSGNEAPRNYHLWCAYIMLAAAVHKRVYVPVGQLKIAPNLYVGLIGSQGSRKTTAKDSAMDLFTETFPDYPILSSVQSREDVIKYMNNEENSFKFTDIEGKEQIVRPVVGFINELMNFFSVDPTKSVQFFTDIYDAKRFKSSTIKRGLEDLVNPCVNFLACATPEWIIENMKGNIISGGWARRIIYVYETARSKAIAFPERPPGYTEVALALMEHLRLVSQTTGVFEWDEDARAYYTEWYEHIHSNPPADKMMAAFYESLHIQAIKVAALLALARRPIQLRITKDNFELSVACLKVLEKNMPKLFAAAGQNELSVPIQTALDALEKAGGAIPEKLFRKLMSIDLEPRRIDDLLRHLKNTEEITIADFKTKDGVVRKFVMLMDFYHQKMQEYGNRTTIGTAVTVPQALGNGGQAQEEPRGNSSEPSGTPSPG